MATLFAFLQHILPKQLLTRIMWRIARVRHVGTKNFLIGRFVALFNIELDDVKASVPEDFATFNDFFIRELHENARPIDSSASGIVSPVDGTISIATTITSTTIIQAKGLDYSIDDLLATNLHEAKQFVDGIFTTIYLAPYNYHRVHAPFDGELIAARYIPGELFSVNGATVRKVSGLFARNERLVMQFTTAVGPMAIIFVGALMVGSISTPWSGEIRPRQKGMVQELDLSSHSTEVKKGDLLGWFNMGSTVILLLPDNVAQWHPKIVGSVRMGEVIGSMTSS